MFRSIRLRSGLTVFLIFLLVVGMILRITGNLGPVEDAVYILFSPVQKAMLGFANGIGNLFGGFQDVNSLRDQVAGLEAQLNKLTVDAVRVRELEIENSQLREQLGYKQANPDYALVGGTVLEANNPDAVRVIGQDPSNLVKYIVIDQGREEGMALGMPVVTPQGLVGRISELGAHWSRVLLMIDPSSSVNGVVQSSRATGIIQGSQDGLLLMKYLPQGESVKVDDLILTSGIGGSFPKRLVIGQVLEVHKKDTDLYQEAVIKPSVDFGRLEFVLVIKQFTPTDITSEPTPTPTPTPTRLPAGAPSPAPTFTPAR
ncbi:MAG: rod shape-determining protein MreC [Anaerolineae bacterium]